MFHELMDWQELVIDADGVMIFHGVVLKVPFGEDIPAGASFSFATVDLMDGWIEFANRNEELEDDQDIVFGHFPLKARLLDRSSAIW